MLINVPVSKLMLSISKAIFKNNASFIFIFLSKTTSICSIRSVNHMLIRATIEQGVLRSPRLSLVQSAYKINEDWERRKEENLMQKQRKQLCKHDFQFHFSASAQFLWVRISKMEGKGMEERHSKRV